MLVRTGKLPKLGFLRPPLTFEDATFTLGYREEKCSIMLRVGSSTPRQIPGQLLQEIKSISPWF